MKNIDIMGMPADPLQRNDTVPTDQRRFAVTCESHGRWIVSDRLGLSGGIFVSEAAARHYVFEESGGHADQSAVHREAAYTSGLLKVA